MRRLAAERPRYGYRRLHVMMSRQGIEMNHKKLYRIYREEGLAVRKKRRKRINAAARQALTAPSKANELWSVDFVSDTLASGRPFRTFNVVDQFSRECPGIEVDTSLPAARVTRTLDRLGAERGLPGAIVLDNGPELAGKVLDEWAYRNGVKLLFIRPGKPVENAFVESFNGKFRDECLSQHWFLSLEDAAARIEDWRVDYNKNRPHSALGNRTPEEFARQAAGLRSATPPSALRPEQQPRLS